MGFFLPENEPVIWRGPMLGRAIEQFLGDVLWGSPDFLLIDLPPGTGDVALTVAQMLPQRRDGHRHHTPGGGKQGRDQGGEDGARMTRHHIAGVIENMSYFTCPGCGETHYIFGRGGAFEIAQAMQTTLLGRIPLDEAARQGGDAGKPPALDPADSTGAVFHEIARTLAAQPATAAGQVGVSAHPRPPTPDASRRALPLLVELGSFCPAGDSPSRIPVACASRVCAATRGDAVGNEGNTGHDISDGLWMRPRPRCPASRRQHQHAAALERLRPRPLLPQRRRPPALRPHGARGAARRPSRWGGGRPAGAGQGPAPAGRRSRRRRTPRTARP